MRAEVLVSKSMAGCTNPAFRLAAEASLRGFWKNNRGSTIAIHRDKGSK